MTSAPAPARPRWRPRLWMLIAIVGLVTVVASVGGLAVVRVYDNQLIRQTESELLAQGVAVGAAYRAALISAGITPSFGIARLETPPSNAEPGSDLDPLLPTLRASDPVLPSPPEAMLATQTPDPFALDAGAAVTPMLEELGHRTLAGVRIIDPGGVVVASSRRDDVHTFVGNRAEVQRALRGLPTSVLSRRYSAFAEHSLASVSRDGALRVVVVVPVVLGERVVGAVVLVRTPMTIAKAAYGDRWNLAATALVLAVVVTLVSFGLSAFVVRPIRALVRRTRAIGSGEGLDEALRTPVVAELAELSASLTTMARLLEERASYVRNFTSSVSHEFKTPLASIRGATELLQEADERLTHEQRTQLLGNVQADAERMTRLVDRLLTLARADMRSSTVARVEVGAVFESLRQRFPAVRVAEAHGTPTAPVPADVLDAVLTHLVENAVQYGGSSVTVAVAVSTDAGVVRIDVRDDGPGVSAANRGRIFEPFFTTARDRGGTGLGLSIARALTRAFHGTLTLRESEVPGAWFRLEFPVE